MEKRRGRIKQEKRRQDKDLSQREVAQNWEKGDLQRKSACQMTGHSKQKVPL